MTDNEGWGLGLTESLTAGRMIIAPVQGGMQDQMRFEDENGDWIVVKGDGWEEIGCVVDIDEDEINMFDGKEGWCVDREEIVSVSWQ